MSRKRVLIVYPYIANYREAIFRELGDLSGDVEFQFASDIKANNDIKLVGDEFYEQGGFRRLKNHWVLGGLWQSGLIQQISKEDYFAVIFLADPSFYSTWIAAIYLKFKSTKIIFWTHGFIRKKSFRDSIKLFFYMLSDILFLYGDRAKDNLIKRGVIESKIFPIYNSLNYMEQKTIRQSLSISTVQENRNKLFPKCSRFQLVFVGRLTPQKKLSAVINMVSELRSEGVLVNLLIIGDGTKKFELLAQVDKLGLGDQVIFYGKTYKEEELALLLMGSDLCVSPGEIGLTAMHVFAYGVPIITHDNEFTQMPEYEVVVDGVTGYLFPDGDYLAMKNRVKTAIKVPIENVKENCIQVIEKKYNPSVQKKLILGVLSEL